MLDNLSYLSVQLWSIRLCTDSAQKISETNFNKDLYTQGTICNSAEILKFQGTILSVPEKDFLIQLLRSGMKSLYFKYQRAFYFVSIQTTTKKNTVDELRPI